MIYLIQSPISLVSRLSLQRAKSAEEDNRPYILFGHEVHPFQGYKFYVLQKAKQEMPHLNMSVYYAPEVEEKAYFPTWQFKKGHEREEIPDIVTFGEIILVSEKVHEVIKKTDWIDHQFVPTSFMDSTGTQIDKGRYFNLHVRRRLEIKESDERPDVDFFSSEPNYLTTVQQDHELRKRVEFFPIWQPTSGNKLYINEDLFIRLKENKITGLDEFSQFAGTGEESVGHV